jgi:hypothetical protein
MAWLFWAPDDKIVISTGSETAVVAIYDLETDQMVTVHGAHLAVFGTKPFRPDGKGFLVTKVEENEAKMSFVDWEGHEQPVVLNEPGKESKQTAFEMLLWPSIFNSSWKGNKAIVSSSQARWEIDSDKLVGKWQMTAAETPNLEIRVRQHFDFSNGIHALQVWERTEWGNEKSAGYLSRLEVVDDRQRKTTVLREIKEKPVLYPSPDGKHVAVFWQNGEYNHPVVANGLLWVIDQEGKVEARLKDRPTKYIGLSGIQVDVGPGQRPPGPLQRCLRFLLRR